MHTIDILLASYNGEKYIEAQIHSLQEQSFTDWKLWVHDDGSTDTTVEKVRQMANQDPRINLIEDGKCYHNLTLNFLSLLSYSQAPYIIFCDQDDIWLEKKLEVLLAAMPQEEKMPIAVYTNSYVYTPNTGDISGFASLAHPKKLEDQLFLNAGIQGCAVLFNGVMRKLLQNAPPYIAMHDHLLTMLALVFGRLIYVPTRQMLYRRYEGAVTGSTHRSLSERMKDFFQSGKTVIREPHYKGTESFYHHYYPVLSNHQREVFEAFIAFPRQTKWKNMQAVLRWGFNLYGKRSILLVKLLFRKIM